MACVALPTCALALTDAERALPEVARSIAEVLADIGLDEEEIGLRMTGCPNGCARPYSTEIGLVGHRRGRYDIHLGGARDGTRLNDLFLESVPTGSVAEALRPLLAAFASGREQGETFGDFVHRHGLDWFKAASMAGKTSS
jgi:sulfite reductase beta subunit-like hemoprotein